VVRVRLPGIYIWLFRCNDLISVLSFQISELIVSVTYGMYEILKVHNFGFVRVLLRFACVEAEGFNTSSYW